MSNEPGVQYDDVYKAMADRHRRRIVSALSEQPMVAGELAGLVQLAPNAVSFHLKWLRSAGLISMRREGRYLRYRANPATLQAWQSHVHSEFRTAPPQFEPVGVAISREDGTAASPRVPSAPTHEQAAPEVAEELLPTELL